MVLKLKSLNARNKMKQRKKQSAISRPNHQENQLTNIHELNNFIDLL